MEKVSLGQLVISKAGHDINRVYVVICIINEQYVYISDGSTKRVKSPKKKKLKHLSIQNSISNEIKYKLIAGKKVTDSEIMSYIKSSNRYREREV